MTTDSNGEFSIKGLAPDLWFTLLAVHEQYVPTLSAKLDPAGSTALSIVLAPLPATSTPSSTARGHVTDAAGNPVHDAIIEPLGLIRGSSSTYGIVEGLDPMAVTNAQGDFELSYPGEPVRVAGADKQGLRITLSPATPRS